MTRAEAAVRVRKRRPRPRKSTVSKTNGPVWRAAPAAAAAAAQVRLHLCYESDNSKQLLHRSRKILVRIEHEQETAGVVKVKKLQKLHENTEKNKKNRI